MMPAAPTTSPFKLLDAYGAGERGIFFGRDEEIQALYERLFETNLVLLYGASGTGKSSLVRCGLASMFAETEWLPVFVRRENDLNASLAAAVAGAFPSPPATERWAGWSWPERIRQLYLARFLPVYLVFDQFEEVFIQGKPDEAETFFETLRALLDSEVQVKILIGMREEYLAVLSDFEHIVPELFANRMRLEKMNRTKLETVVGESADAFDIDFEEREATIEAVIRQVRDGRGEVELASLQIYLDKLYRNDATRRETEKQPRGPRFDPALVAATKTLEDVLSDFLDTEVNRLEGELAARGVAKKGVPIAVLFSLVTDDATKRMRTARRIRQEIEERYGVAPEHIDYCIARFVELRLIKILGSES